jgi:hypothetical protein
VDSPFVSSDPNAYLRSYWRELHSQSHLFANLPSELRVQALADALDADHPAKAAEIREWNPATT